MAVVKWNDHDYYEFKCDRYTYDMVMNIIRWCIHMFGDSGQPYILPRWITPMSTTAGQRSFYFRDEEDYNWFMLRWS